MRNAASGRRRSASRKIAGATFVAAAIGGAVAIGTVTGSASGDGWEGVAVLRDAAGNQVGKVKFEGDENGTAVKVNVHGITERLDGYHGLHLHANDGAGQCDPAAANGPFTDVGGHWNPTMLDHGSHAGDLPSLQVLLDGSGSARSVTGRFEPGDIGGRAVILHAGPDNFGNIPPRYTTGQPPIAGADAATKATGDAGGRIACGIVELD
jgi:Cu-Zn family superoxide dismutase